MELEEIRKTARKNKAGNKTRSILFCMQLVNTNTFKNNQKKKSVQHISYNFMQNSMDYLVTRMYSA